MLPDPRLKAHDNLPRFRIIEENLKESNEKRLKELQKKSSDKNPRKVGHAVEFYEYLNKTQIYDLQERQKKPVPKSTSLGARRRNKVSNVIDDHGFDIAYDRGNMDEEYL